MHWIQFNILEQLIDNKTCRFSELRPSRVESNLFQWHLKQVMKLGYVEKLPGGTGYRLSPKGLYFADRLSSTLKSERIQPKIITIIALRNFRGEFLLHTKHRQPYIDTARFPAGKVHNDESLVDAARRETYEKMGLEINNLSSAGCVHVQVRLRGEPTSEYYGFVFTGEYDGTLPNGAFWFDKDDEEINLMPSVREVMNYILSDESNMREYEVEAANS